MLEWTMRETCANTRNTIPIWAKQGINYQHRHVAWQDSKNIERMKSTMLEPEAQTLEERFGPHLPDTQSFLDPGPTSEPRHAELCLIKDKCREFTISTLRRAEIQEEQERELAHEVERETQIERPPKATAHGHHIHPDVREFIRTGNVKRNSPAFFRAFDTLSRTSIEKYRQPDSWTNHLLTTKDFATTIHIKQKDEYMDGFLRPVHWVISSTSGDSKFFVIMSPHEVNDLIPMIHQYRSVRIHMYSPKVTKGMKSFEDLAFCPIAPVLGPPTEIPDSLVQQLNIFAGQLYLRDYDAYERLCEFLGLYLKEIPPGETISIHSDGFIGDASARTALGMGNSPFSKSPVSFLKKLMDCRRKGQTYKATHMGQILYGRLLTEKDFDQEPDRCNEDGESNEDGENTNLLVELANLRVEPGGRI